MLSLCPAFTVWPSLGGEHCANGCPVLLSLLLSPTLISAQESSTNAASTFLLHDSSTQFSLNIANDSSDVFIYFTSPVHAWVGVGFGSKMEDSLMFIMYPNDQGNNVTVSPRIGSRSSEPTLEPGIQLYPLPGTTINNSMLILKARCHNCRTWRTGAIDVDSVAQPMIYAFGDAANINTNSQSADLGRHFLYGHFTMDLVSATGSGGVPAASDRLQGATMVGTVVKDHDRKNLAHAIMGCIALFGLWPLHTILAGCAKKIKTRRCVLMLIIGSLVTSYALGIATSAEFNRSKKYSSPHQIIAFAALVSIVLLSIIPITRLGNWLPRLRPFRVVFTPVAFVLFVLAGGLGLSLASQIPAIIIGYTAVAFVIFLIILILEPVIQRRGSADAQAREFDDSQRELDRKPISADARKDSSYSTDTHASKDRYGNGAGLSSSGSTVLAPEQTCENRYANNITDFRRHGQRYQRRPSQTNGLFGGGTMPGPQYLLNMHPGVPVQIERM